MPRGHVARMATYRGLSVDSLGWMRCEEVGHRKASHTALVQSRGVCWGLTFVFHAYGHST